MTLGQRNHGPAAEPPSDQIERSLATPATLRKAGAQAAARHVTLRAANALTQPSAIGPATLLRARNHSPAAELLSGEIDQFGHDVFWPCYITANPAVGLRTRMVGLRPAGALKPFWPAAD
jgi:hypothetical protein